MALANRTNVDIDSPPESHGSGKKYATPSPGSSAGRKTPPSRAPPSSDVRLHHRAVVVAAGLDGNAGGLGSLVRQLSIDQFENENKRIGPAEMPTPARMGGPEPGLMTPNSGARGGYVLDDEADSQLVHKKVLNQLLHPRSWEPATDRGFILDVAEIDALRGGGGEVSRRTHRASPPSADQDLRRPARTVRGSDAPVRGVRVPFHGG